jgi:hypothetical protein
MASRSYSLSFGQTAFNVAEGTNAPGAGDVEVRINLANIPQPGTNNDVIVKLQEIIDWLTGRSPSIN